VDPGNTHRTPSGAEPSAAQPGSRSTLPNRLRAWARAVTGRQALAAAALAAGLYVQYVVGLAPCPLCVLQRMGYIAAGTFALAGAVVARGRLAQAVSAVLALGAALAGGAIAAWHTWLLAHPREGMSCGRPFEWFHEDFPLAVWLPRLFRGDGDCFDESWTLLGLAIPHWSLLVFTALIAMSAWGLTVAVRRG
jgi:disulfide bond formation protein DsbB